MIIHPLRNRSRAFSLVEVALAVTIVAVVILAAIGLLVPAQRAIDDVLGTDQATRLRAEIEKELSVVRPGETYASGFDKAYKILQKSNDREGLLCAFSYRAEKPTGGAGTSATDTDGRLKPFTETVKDKRVGEDYVIQAAVMTVAKFETQKKMLDAIEGKLFVVRLTYLKGLLPPESDAAFGGGSSDSFPEAVLPATAEFFMAEDIDDPSASFERIKKGFVKPVLTLNLGFNR